ncbi:hypothetical protein [Enterovibrio coralii]|uniref:Phytanoyl-CoA dioxygenase n=1 Tax=Enterovibrio coralii TaxID=294935 RepID=A0A135I8S0_9GAMM|nr:hypothetical protein [Enterovibrio coralii]KXF81853.1 hypothetical protein ATN88_20375 [Enterovibrio coralii]
MKVLSETLLSPPDCARLVDKLFSLRSAWTSRSEHNNETGGFYTLGTASYIDANHSCDVQTTYYDSAMVTNQILRDNFSDILELLKYVFSQYLSSPVLFDDDLALPGFHIFHGSSITLEPTNLMGHFDLQFLPLRWKGVWNQAYPPLSFTLVLQLPEKGGDFEWWNKTYADLRHHSITDWIAEHPDPIREVLKVGSMVIQNGLVLHRIGRSHSNSESDYRITLQGHLIRVGDYYYMYW